MKLKLIFTLTTLLSGASLGNAESFTPPENPIAEPEAYQMALSALSAGKMRVIHQLDGYYDSRSQIVMLYEFWIDPLTHQYRKLVRRVVNTKATIDPLARIDTLQAEKPVSGIWRTIYGDLAYFSEDNEWRVVRVNAASPVTNNLKAIKKDWLVWSAFERPSDSGSLCCGQVPSAEKNSYQERVKRFQERLTHIASGRDSQTVSEDGGLVKEFGAKSAPGGIFVHRLINEYLTDWPFEMDDKTKAEVQKKSSFAIFNLKSRGNPAPEIGKGYGILLNAGLDGAKVRAVLDGSPAAKVGISAGDFLLGINGVAVDETGGNAIGELQKSETAVLMLKRPNGSTYTVSIAKADRTPPLR